MSTQASELFKSNEDYLKWDNYVANCDHIDGLAVDKREAAIEALQYLRGVFGEQFLRRAFNQRDRKHPHPLIQTIMMQASWSRLWLIHFIGALRALSGVTNYGGLLKRIKNSNGFAEVESVLEVAFQLFRAGFSVSFDPEVMVIDGVGRLRKKTPDLKIISDTGDEAIVEVSLLVQSIGFVKSEEVMRFILPLMVDDFRELTLYAKMTDAIDESRVPETRTQLQSLAAEAKLTGKFCALVNDCIEAGTAPNAELELLDQWAEQRGICKAISGPPVYSNELARAIMKIRDKLAQLPADLPGIIVIPATGSALFHRFGLEEILGTLTEEISRYPKVFCVVLSHGYFGGTSHELPTALIGPNAVASRTLGGILKEQSLILMNPSCKFSASQALARKLHQAFASSG